MSTCDIDAVQLRRLIGSRELSPVEVVDDCIARVGAVNPSLNAIVAECFDRARREARAAEAKVMAAETLGVLHGLPIAIKDLTETEGLLTTFGSPRYRHHVPLRDENIVAAIRRHGGIVLGKSNTPEFGIGGNTRNRVYGPTRNPFAPHLTPGGSSGGAAVAVATGMVPLATGTDSGGSLRNPAAFCGVVGYRPTPGLIPSDRRAQGWSPMGVHGPIARSVADVALLLQAMAHHDACDPLSYREPLRFDTLDLVEPGNLVIGISEDLGFAPISSPIAGAFGRKAALFRSLFGKCCSIPLRMETAERVSWILRCLYLLSSHGTRLAEYPDELEPRLRDNLRAALRLSAADIAWALAEQSRIYRAFEAAMRDCSILICPAAAVSPFPVDCEYPDSIDGAPLDHYAQWMSITYGVTLVGHPALVIPCGLDDAGMPFGIQLIARPHQDHLLLSAGRAIEQAFAAIPALARPVPGTAAGRMPGRPDGPASPYTLRKG